MKTTIASLFAMFGCIAPDSTSRIEVSEPNDLGVHAVTTERSMVDGNRVFTLRAFDARDAEVGMLRLTTGSVAELPTVLPGPSDRGSEIVVAVGEDTTRILTRETRTFHVTPRLLRGAGSQLVALASVSSAMAREANIEVAAPAPEPNPDRAYFTVTCWPWYLNQTPLAQQCCLQYKDIDEWTVFSRSTDQAIVERQRNPITDGISWPGSSACRASDGVSACSGNACYFGPNGFGRAFVYLPWQPYPTVFTSYGANGAGYCGMGFAAQPQKPTFGDVKGTFPTGAGCPTGSGSSGEYEWDY